MRIRSTIVSGTVALVATFWVARADWTHARHAADTARASVQVPAADEHFNASDTSE
jgi:hypothetical protein